MRLFAVVLLGLLSFTFAHGKKRARYSFKVPILCYHQVSDKGRGRFNIEPAVFEQQMHYLFVNGYTVIPLERLVRFMRSYHSGGAGRIFLPRKPIVITFDDNYPSIFRVAGKILKKYRFKATNFIYTRFMSSRNWRIYRKVRANGFSLQSHTLNHVDLTRRFRRETKAEYRKRIFNEIVGSRRFLSEKLRTNVRYLAYPFGVYNKMVVRFSRLAGYVAMFSALGGYVNEKSTLDAIPRFTMFNSFDMELFVKIVSGRWYKGMGTYKNLVRRINVRDYNFDF